MSAARYGTAAQQPLLGFPAPIIYLGRRRRTEVIAQRANTHTLGGARFAFPTPPQQPLLLAWEAGEI